MGRIFETRKHKMFARYDRMAKAFTRIGKDIAMAVKAGGPDPAYNPRLRQAIINAKGVNMPKDRVEAAIKRAVSKDSSNFEEMVYEGYGPHGVAILVETATDNPTRTVANIRLYFNRAGGTLGTSGSLKFIFDRKGVFHLAPENVQNPEELELELIDAGLESIEKEEGGYILFTAFADFGNMQKALEDRGIEVKKAALERVPQSFAEITEAQMDEILELVEKIEEDDDVQAVYHNLK
ncbi:MAG: YebC/PmpR family DNA-binding transcriptional regulator [Crocinitomicaceae bacterium]|nr:YebC/PmpR family DNA-binding transcriptional regulator [Crocinitomicaceae bacterium]